MYTNLVQTIVIPFQQVEDFRIGELRCLDYEMDLFTMSNKKQRVVYDVDINPKNLGNAQPLHFLQYLK
jgi:hypothetical protein